MAISLILVAWLIPFNLKENYSAYVDSVNNSTVPENAEEMIIVYNGVAAIGGLAILISAYVPAVIATLNSAVSLVFSIKNRKSDLKSIRIINFIYDVILVSIIAFCIVKIILFRTGVA